MMYVGDHEAQGAPFCCQSINRQLHLDDIAAAQYVYGLRGDYNQDRRVDAADYIAWQKTEGQSLTSGTGGDGNVDGVVNANDLTEWQSHFGAVSHLGFGEQPSFGAGGGVPEPSSLLLLFIAAFFLRDWLR
jgi:hypothetical protein